MSALIGPRDGTAVKLGLSTGRSGREGENSGVLDVREGVEDDVTGTVVSGGPLPPSIRVVKTVGPIDCKEYSLGLLVCHCSELGDFAVFGFKFGFALGEELDLFSIVGNLDILGLPDGLGLTGASSLLGSRLGDALRASFGSFAILGNRLKFKISFDV